METESVKMFHNTKFHGIDCMENDKEYGFEGYYMEDINEILTEDDSEDPIKQEMKEQVDKNYDEEIFDKEGAKFV